MDFDPDEPEPDEPELEDPEPEEPEPDELDPDLAGVLEDEEPFVDADPFELLLAPASDEPADVEESDPPDDDVEPAVSDALPLLRESVR